METDSLSAPHFRDIFRDGFVARVHRSVIAMINGKYTWRDFKNRTIKQDKELQYHLFRQDIHLDQYTSIDDASCIRKMRQKVNLQPNGPNDRIAITVALLTSSFFFELDGFPQFELGWFRCEGTVYCRNHSYGVVSALTKSCGSSLSFFNDHNFLGDFGGLTALCNQCRRYRKRVTFFVKNVTDQINIYLKPKD